MNKHYKDSRRSYTILLANYFFFFFGCWKVLTTKLLFFFFVSNMKSWNSLSVAYDGNQMLIELACFSFASFLHILANPSLPIYC